MYTREAVSPVAGLQVGLSLVAFVAVYLAVFGAGAYYILRLILKGPEPDKPDEREDRAYGTRGVERPALVSDIISESGGSHV